MLLYSDILKCKNFLIGFLDELGNFKKKKFALQNVIFFYILEQRTLLSYKKMPHFKILLPSVYVERKEFFLFGIYHYYGVHFLDNLSTFLHHRPKLLCKRSDDWGVHSALNVKKNAISLKILSKNDL